MKKLWEDPKFREARSQGAIKQWEDPEYKTKMSKISSIVGKKTMITLNQNSDFKEMMREKVYDNVEFLKRRADRIQKFFSDPEKNKKFREQRSDIMSTMWDSEEGEVRKKEERARMILKNSNPEHQKKAMRGKVLKSTRSMVKAQGFITSSIYNLNRNFVPAWENLVPKYFDSYEELINLSTEKSN